MRLDAGRGSSRSTLVNPRPRTTSTHEDALPSTQRQYEQAMQAAYAPVQHYEPAPTPKHTQVAPAPASQPLNPSRFDPDRVGFSSSRGYEPLRHRSSNANTTALRTGPGYTEPTRVQDQYGNGYIRPPGSHFVTDEKTGRQCLAVGGTIRCD